MPLYEYECQDCKEKFTALIRNPEDENNLTCSKCASKRIKRLLSTFSTAKSGNEKDSSFSGPSCSCAGPC
jgi:putative FmdB family regulatory protein